MRFPTILILFITLFATAQANAGDALDCEHGETLEHTFKSGANWSFCAVIDKQHALELKHVHYRAPGDTSREVLEQVHLGQLMLHYHDAIEAIALLGEPTFGSDALLTLDNQVCDGELLSVGEQANMLCSIVNDTGLLAKYNLRKGLQGQQFRLFSVSRMHGLTFQTGYGLSEDGKVEPFVSVSGSPSKTTTDPRFGNAIVNPLTNANIVGTQATLLFTWRMVFALNGDGSNDIVDELNFKIDDDSGSRRPMQVSTLETETLRETDREKFRGWLIRDAVLGGYYLDPQKSGFSFADGKNNWVQFDLALTAFNDCERHTRIQSAPSVGITNDECSGSLDDFVSGQSMVNQQPVLWYSLSRLFRPSAEDYPIMSSVRAEFELLPFDWTAASPFEVVR